MIQEWYFREQDSASPSAQTFAGSGPMSSNGWKAAANTRLAAYWPSVIFQDESNQMQEVYDANLTFVRSAVGLKSRNGSAFAELPYSVTAGRYGGEKILYQRDDQKLILEERSNLTNKLNVGEFLFNQIYSIPNQRRRSRSWLKPLDRCTTLCHSTQRRHGSLYRPTILQLIRWRHEHLHTMAKQLTSSPDDLGGRRRWVANLIDAYFPRQTRQRHGHILPHPDALDRRLFAIRLQHGPLLFFGRWADTRGAI